MVATCTEIPALTNLYNGAEELACASRLHPPPLRQATLAALSELTRLVTGRNSSRPRSADRTERDAGLMRRLNGSVIRAVLTDGDLDLATLSAPCSRSLAAALTRLADVIEGVMRF